MIDNYVAVWQIVEERSSVIGQPPPLTRVLPAPPLKCKHGQTAPYLMSFSKNENERNNNRYIMGLV